MFIFIELPHEEKGFDLYHIKNMISIVDNMKISNSYYQKYIYYKNLYLNSKQ